MSRRGGRSRSTKETTIEVAIDLDGDGTTSISTGLPFYDHMLDQLGRHGGFDLTIQAAGDLHIDSHHTVEDVAIALGEAFRDALGDKAGVRRFASGLYPLDEALVEVALDLSGRPYVVWEVELPECLPLGSPPFDPQLAEHAVAQLRHRGGHHAPRHPAPRPQRAPHHRGHLQGPGPQPPRRRPDRGRGACRRPRACCERGRERGRSSRCSTTGSATCARPRRRSSTSAPTPGSRLIAASSRTRPRWCCPGSARSVVAWRRCGGRGWRSVAVGAVASGRPFLGICIGMQMLFSGSEEEPTARGSGRHPRSGRLDPDRGEASADAVEPPRRPPPGATRLLASLDDRPWVYFVHSLHGVPEDADAVIATCEYGGDDQRRVPARQRRRHAVPPGEVRAGGAAAPGRVHRGRGGRPGALMDLFPAIDLRGGQVVRLLRGDYAQEVVYDADPVARRRGLRRGRGPVDPRRRPGRRPHRRARQPGHGGGHRRGGGRPRPRADGRRRPLGRRRTGARRRRRRPRRDGFGRACDARPRRAGGRAPPGRRGPRPPRRRARRPRLDRGQRPAPAGRARPLPGRATRSSSPTSAGTARWPDPTSRAWPRCSAATSVPVIASGGVGTLDDLRALAAAAGAGRGDRGQGALRGPLRRRRRSRRAGRGPVVRVARVIPCLDVDRRPRRQGRRSSSACATPATRSSWPPATTPRAPTSWSSSTSPLLGRTRHDGRRRGPDGRAGLHPADGRRRHPGRRGRPPAAAGGRRQGQREHLGGASARS